MASANELIMIFIGLEISSIASYILAGFLRDDPRNNESALKYFLLGSFATAFLLYGVAWIYGATGSTNLAQIHLTLLSGASLSPIPDRSRRSTHLRRPSLQALRCPFPGLGTGRLLRVLPAPISGFMTVGPKAAAFAVMIRIFTLGLGSISDRWLPVVWACALATMFVGNLAALKQTNIKRMLAYSSIAHAGYVLVAIAQLRHGFGCSDVLPRCLRLYQHRSLHYRVPLRPQGREVRSDRRPGWTVAKAARQWPRC